MRFQEGVRGGLALHASHRSWAERQLAQGGHKRFHTSQIVRSHLQEGQLVPTPGLGESRSSAERPGIWLMRHWGGGTCCLVKAASSVAPSVCISAAGWFRRTPTWQPRRQDS